MSFLPDFPPDTRLFFLYGADLARLSNVRREALARLIPVEERDQNLTEIEPSVGRQLSLDALAPGLIEELSTAAFFPDQRRVIMVSGLQELFAAGARAAAKKPAKAPKKSAKTAKASAADPEKPKKTGEELLLEYLDGDFRRSRNALIILAEEDEAKNRRVNEKGRLAEYLFNRAAVVACKEPPIRFEFEQALYDRDAARAVLLYRQWIEPDTRASVLSAVTNAVRMMLQIKARDSAPNARRSLEDYFPRGRGSLSSAHQFVVRKAETGARRYTVMELARAQAALLELNDAFYPPPGATWAADLDAAVETFLLRLCQ
jgi:hypothetical protein